VFTGVRHWSLARWIHSTVAHPVSLRFILKLSSHLMSKSSTWSVYFEFSDQNFISSLHVCYMPYLSHPPWIDDPNKIYRTIQILKLLLLHAFLHPPVTSPLLGPYILLCTLFFNPLNLSSSRLKDRYKPIFAHTNYLFWNIFIGTWLNIVFYEPLAQQK
jgi:hypothetical protein